MVVVMCMYVCHVIIRLGDDEDNIVAYEGKKIYKRKKYFKRKYK